MSNLVGLLAFCSLFVSSVFAQNAPSADPSGSRDYSFTVPASKDWTDTGLDLKPGELAQISSTTTGCGSQKANAPAQSLPLPSAPAGSLIARLHGPGTTPVAVGASTEIRVQEPSHLYLGVNGGDCSGNLTAKVRVVPANLANSAEQTQTSQSQKLKQELGNAANVWLQGQFGVGNAGSTAAPGTAGSAATSNNVPASTAPLKVSEGSLDSKLRKDIDGLPRRVNDQLKNLGDMVNFILVGSEQQVKGLLEAADWHLADTGNTNAVLAAAVDTYEKKDYLAMPMSILYLFDRRQDFGYEQAEPIAMVASRHHFRLWKAPFKWDGQDVWVGAGTHDIGFAKDKRNGKVTHKIDPDVDSERTNIGQSLEKSGKVKTMNYYLPPNPVQEAKNATGDAYHSDGRLLVVFLK